MVVSLSQGWNKLVNWNDMEEHIQFQLEDLPVYTNFVAVDPSHSMADY